MANSAGGSLVLQRLSFWACPGQKIGAFWTVFGQPVYALTTGTFVQKLSGDGVRLEWPLRLTSGEGDEVIFAPEEPGVETLRAPVIKVFDGDGILTRLMSVESGEQANVAVRFGFIDAPEIDQRGGVEAREFLASLIEGKWLDLALLVKDHSGRTSDRWGRIFCVPYLRGIAPDGRQRSRNIELEMVLNGWAWVLDCWGPPDHYNDALVDAQRNRRGIWAWNDNIAPWTFKQRKKKRDAAASRQSDLFGLRHPPRDESST